MQSILIQDFQRQQQQEETKIRRPGIVANFICKIVELATYTDAFATDAINTLTLNTGGHSMRQNYGYDDIDDDDENVYDHKKKDVSTWGENVETVEDEVPPPPYDNSWSMTSSTTTTNTTTTETKPSQQDYPTTQTETEPSLTISTSSSQQDFPTTQKVVSAPTHSPTNSTSRRRQFRVHRGCRFIRRKSSSVDMSDNFKNTSTVSDNNVNDDEDIDIALKRLNSKISVMIAEGETALNSKVEVTEVEMILAEEKEREERIMKEVGIQTPISRRARTNFNVHNYNYNNYNNNSPSVDMSDNFNNTSTVTDNNVDDDEDIDIALKRLNSKISVMIAEGEAALNSKVEVTEVEMILAEDKEREERIMKEVGIQTPISRRARTNFNVRNYNYNNYNNNSPSVDMSDNFNNTSTVTDNNVDDEDIDIVLKRLNSKISVMIAEGEAALNSKVEVTEVEMILAEDKEREERIMKEVGIQTPISRRARNNYNNNYNYNNYNSNYNYSNYNNNYNNHRRYKTLSADLSNQKFYER